jgi:hypothetical protein
MKYYILSLIITVIIFIIIQYLEYSRISNIYVNEDDEYIETYSLFNLNNVLLFTIIYVVFTIGSYYLSSSFKIPDMITNLISVPEQTPVETDTRNDIDPKILSRINDNFDIGFEPFEDDSSISSDSTVEEKLI